MKSYLLRVLNQINDLNPELDILESGESLRALIHEVEMMASRAGQPNVVKICQSVTSPMIGVKAARLIVSQCIESIEPEDGQPLTVKQAAEKLQISERKIYQLCNDGELRHRKSPIRIEPGDLDLYVERSKKDNDNPFMNLP